MLTEILKDSPIPPATLLRIIQGEGVRPRWTEIALPYGRSVSACQKAFDSLYCRVFQIPLQPLGPVPQPSPSAKSRKRPATSTDASSGSNRELQPRTPGFVTVNEPIESSAYPPALAENIDQRKKKRGRPSKAEVEVKAAEYAARGEPYPPPRRSKNPKPAEGTATIGSSITFTPVTMGPSGMEGISSGKKRATKAKPQKDEMVPGYGPAASPIQQILGETRDPIRGHSPTSQASQAVSSEPVAGAGLAVQDQTMRAPTGAPMEGPVEAPVGAPMETPVAAPTEGFMGRPNVIEPYRQQNAPEMPVGLTGYEESSRAQRHEAGNATLQASTTASQQATSEHGSPQVMHSQKQA
ncbi:MAG: hypothetical protein Q9196_001918 [Gyalolechia fulgens]